MDFHNITRSASSSDETLFLGKPNMFIIHYSRNKSHVATAKKDTSKHTEVPFFTQSLLSLLANVILLAFIMSRLKLRSKLSSKFFLNLLCTHIILSVVGLAAHSRFYLPNEEVIINNGFLIEMFLSLIMTTCDRYIAIKYPFTYELLDRKMFIVGIMSSWFISTTAVTVSLVYETTQYRWTVITTTMIVVSTTTLAASNINIYKIARKHVRVIQKQHRALNSTHRNEIRTMKSMYVCFSIVLSFIILWLPYFAHNVMILTDVYEPGREMLFTKIVVQLAFLNSLADPILYVCFNKDAKQEISKIFKRNNVNPFKRGNVTNSV